MILGFSQLIQSTECAWHLANPFHHHSSHPLTHLSFGIFYPFFLFICTYIVQSRLLHRFFFQSSNAEELYTQKNDGSIVFPSLIICSGVGQKKPKRDDSITHALDICSFQGFREFDRFLVYFGCMCVMYTFALCMCSYARTVP